MKSGKDRKQRCIRLAMVIWLALFSQRAVRAQDLAPRAYLITPYHSNAVTLTWSFYDGSIDFNGTLPSSDATGTYSLFIGNFYHSFGIFGRSANVLAVVPYAEGNFQGTVNGAGVHLYRSGLTDSFYRVAINLKGGPAMEPREFIKWKQKVLLGASLRCKHPRDNMIPRNSLTGVVTAGPSSPNLAIRSAGGSGWSMLTRECGFSQRTTTSGHGMSSIRGRERNRKSPSHHLKHT